MPGVDILASAMTGANAAFLADLYARWVQAPDSVDPSFGELFAALTVSLIATVLKFGDRTQLGAVHLATSLVADLQLVAAGIVWVVADSSAEGLTAASTAAAVSLSGGALLANLVSVVLLVSETVGYHRR